MADSSRLFEEVDVSFGKLKLAVTDVSDDLPLCWLLCIVLYCTYDTIHLNVRIQRRQRKGCGVAWGTKMMN